MFAQDWYSTCKVHYHGLIVEKRLEAALGYLWLVGGVLRGPAGVLEHVAQDGVGDTGVVVAHADIGLPYL